MLESSPAILGHTSSLQYYTIICVWDRYPVRTSIRSVSGSDRYPVRSVPDTCRIGNNDGLSIFPCAVSHLANVDLSQILCLTNVDLSVYGATLESSPAILGHTSTTPSFVCGTGFRFGQVSGPDRYPVRSVPDTCRMGNKDDICALASFSWSRLR